MAGRCWPNSVRVERHSIDCPKCRTGTLSRISNKCEHFMCIDCFEMFKRIDGAIVRMNAVEQKKYRAK